MNEFCRIAVVVFFTTFFFSSAGRATVAESIAAIRAVGPEGKGNAEAARGWQELARADAAVLPELFRAMDGANELAANWLRSAVETIVDRSLASGGQLPLDALHDILRDTGRNPRARRFAYELIARVQPGIANGIIPRMTDDPSLELRYDAVQRLIEEGGRLAAEAKADEATRVYRRALDSAREIKQIQQIKGAMDKLGVTVDLPRHFGFLMQWRLIGPFDNTGRKGFDMVLPPEQAIDLAAEYPGKTGPVRWAPFTSEHEYGLINFNLPYGPLKEVTGYAYAEFQSDAARPAELRLGCKNAWKLWANGRLLFSRDEYHRGMEIDQYRFPVELKAGKNSILIKVCQSEQTETWTKEWEFQLRVCDARGTAILSADRPPSTIAKGTPK
ncbi:MAG TPA: hypothetical protein PLU30_07725 [Verrucomicrobiae bacterium]|nr:hypothetical protein [Verrucomicrobiae bacterium]